MPVREIAGSQVDVDDEGFLTDPEQCNEDIARVLAAEEGIDELGEGHWKFINFMREDNKA